MDDSYFDAPPMPDLYDEDVDPPDEYNREEMIREEELSNDDLS
jgi:hypothetical protein